LLTAWKHAADLVEGVAFLQSMSDTWKNCNSFMYTHLLVAPGAVPIDLDRTDEALRSTTSAYGASTRSAEDQSHLAAGAA